MIRTLIVDADGSSRALVAAVLREHGAVAHEAETCAGADALLAREVVDVILVDSNLPDGLGVDWIARLRTRDNRVRVVLTISAPIAPNPSTRPLQELDVSTVLHKPVPAAELATWLLQFGAAKPPSVPANASLSGPGWVELRNRFASRLPDKITEIENAIDAVRNGQGQLDAGQALIQRLRSSAGSHGYEAVGAALGRLEDLLSETAERHGTEPRRNFWVEVESALRDTRLALQRTPVPPPPGTEILRAQGKVLLFVDSDPELLRAARNAGRKQLLEVVTAQNEEDALRCAQSQSLLGAILPIDAAGIPAFGLARRIRDFAPQGTVPIAFTSQEQSVETLIAAVDAGGSRVFERSGADEDLTAIVQHFANLQDTEQGHVMVVDDDPEVIAHYERHLRAAGIAVTSLTSAEHILERLDERRVDALLLDVNLPRISGLEICRALRMSGRRQLLPILIVTAHTDARTRIEAFRAGASDVVTKPVLPVELLARVSVQLDRARLVRERSERDALSGVLLRRAFVESLQRSLALCARHDEPLALALIDLDRFKRINDSYGHLAGDQVIARFGSLLRRSFRVEDLRGRWGGEEFILAFPGANTDFAERAANRLLEEFRSLHFYSETNETFSASFTAGVVCYPDDGTSLAALVRHADELLYAGKQEGRNRVRRPPGRHGNSGLPVAATEQTPLRVLLIDDEEDIRKIAKLGLEKVGKLPTITAASAQEGLELAIRERPDVILMDMMMPGVDGLSALEQLRLCREVAHIPVLFITAKVQRGEVADYLAAGAVGVIQKPFNPLTLAAEVRRILAASAPSGS